MAENSNIEWTDATWQPITGCSVTSPGCTNCYAMKLAGTRLRHHPSRAGLTRETKAGPVWTGEVRLNEQWLTQPLQWRRPRRIFVCAHGDLFHESVPDEWIDRVFAVMALLAPQHTFQVLTKRSDRMLKYMRDIIAPYPNIWLGVSVEDSPRRARISDLRATPAAVRFLSIEPLLGDMRCLDLRGIDWCIVGGESGPGARRCWVPMVRDVVRQCQAASVAVFVKQLGSFVTDRNDAGFEGDEEDHWPDVDPDDIKHDLDGTLDGYQGAPVRIRLRHPKGADMSEWPADLRIRQMPRLDGAAHDAMPERG